MSMRGTDIAEFYHQLAVLVDANLPLPDSLKKLGAAFPNAPFRKVLAEVSARVDAGESFSAVLQDYPACFDPQHIEMVAAGESADALDRMLYAIAEVARFKTGFVLRMQQVATYPFVVLNFALVIFLGAAYFVAPSSLALVSGISPGSDASMSLSLRIAELTSLFVHRFPFITIAVCLASVGISVWLLSGGRAAQGMLLRITSRIPGMRRFVHMQDTVLMCQSLSSLLPAGLSVPDACRKTAGMLGCLDMTRALNNVAARVESGMDWAPAIREEPSLDNMMALTIAHVPEEELSGELRGLADYFMTRVMYGTRSLLITWNAILFVVMVFVVWTAVQAMLMPLLAMMDQLA